MNVLILTPPNPVSVPNGNHVSLGRWRGILRDGGHVVRVVDLDAAQGELPPVAAKPDVVIALHAKYSGRLIQTLRRDCPGLPIVLVLTGTDLYRDFPRGSKTVQHSLDLCDRIVVLQDQAIKELPKRLRKKCDVIYQSCLPTRAQVKPLRSVFELTVVGHLRSEKDPLRTAYAVRGLPIDSRVRVTHIGGCYSASWQNRLEREVEQNPRYRWLGPLPLAQTRRYIARSQAVVISSKMEGAGNVISEAIADGVPVLSSRISGAVGMLGRDYAGFYTTGSDSELRQLIVHFEADASFRDQLRKQIENRQPLVALDREKKAWLDLVKDLS